MQIIIHQFLMTFSMKWYLECSHPASHHQTGSALYVIPVARNLGWQVWVCWTISHVNAEYRYAVGRIVLARRYLLLVLELGWVPRMWPPGQAGSSLEWQDYSRPSLDSKPSSESGCIRKKSFTPQTYRYRPKGCNLSNTINLNLKQKYLFLLIMWLLNKW